MLLLFLLFSLANAHVPVFDSNSEALKITEKSWGVYRELKKHESFSVFLDVPKDENISFSINLAGIQDEKFDKDLTYIDVTLLGHNASQIKCDPTFTGWGHDNHTARRLDGGLDQSVHIPQKYGKLHFEPFGVGYYRSLAACQGKVPVADSNFTVTVKALEVVPWSDETDDDVLRISIGAGMAESFAVDEIAYLPVTITRTWIWDHYLLGFILTQMAGLFSIFLLVFGYGPWKTGERLCRPCWKWSSAYTLLAGKYFMIGVLFHNILVYTIRMITVIRYTQHAENSEFDEMVNVNLFVAWLIHVIVPGFFLLVVALVDYRYDREGLKCGAFYFFHILFIFICAVLLIQTFWLGAIAAIILFVTRRQLLNDYSEVPQEDLPVTAEVVPVVP